MTSHGAILHNCLGAYHLLADIGLDDEVFLSFLPLSHSYEHTTGLHFPISVGAQIYYAESLDKLIHNLAEAQPTIMTAVPRLYEVMRSKILHGIERKGGLSAKLFHAAVALGKDAYVKSGRIPLHHKLFNALLDVLVRRKVAARFGGRLKAFVSGGGPLNLDVGLFFHALGVRILQGYGQTETGPVVSCNLPHRVRMHTVGPPFHDTEVKIADDGEILVRGELVMQGYWNNPDFTREVLQSDGWLHTGDIGVIDQDGYLQITDRKKDIIVLSGGDNVAPQRVEGLLTLQTEIAQAMVYGDRHPHLVALIVPDDTWAKQWATGNDRPHTLGSLVGDPDFRAAVSKAVDRVNKDLAALEKVRRFALVEEPFSVGNGMMTPTLKVRRHMVRETYGETLEGLYGK